jgi:shikimate kinase
MVITLIGYRGTGKSSVAGALGARLGWGAVDADDDIEARAGKSIERIFAEDGEAEFRRLERETMQRLLSQGDRLVIAAGGGAILNEQTREDMQQAGPVVWLTAPVDTILARIGGDETTASRRPNLTAQGGRAEVEQVLAKREPLYRQTASLIVDTQGRTIDEIVEAILAGLPPHLQEGAAG